jgi:hypothetical protein
MTARFKFPSLLALGALLACVAFAAEGHAQGNNKGKRRPPDRRALDEQLRKEAEQRAAVLEALKKHAEQQKKVLSAAQKAAAEGKKFAEAEVLRDAYLLLAGAGHDFKGHRTKAMHEIEEAVKILDASIIKNGTAMEKAMTRLAEKATASASQQESAEATPYAYELLLTSSPLLRSAREWLVLAQKSLDRNEQEKPLKHVDAAIAEIDAALKAAKELKEFLQAEGLRQAYLLLAWSNHDYDGYRHRAMNEVQAAVNILDADITKNGSALLKAKEALEKKTVAAVKAESDAMPDLHEIQLASRTLLKSASEWLVLVERSLHQDNQRQAERHVHKAIHDIKLALDLTQWTRFHEAEALKEAYLLLAAANDAVGGHRSEAMRQIEAAIKDLEPRLLEGSRMEQAAKAKAIEQLRLVSDLHYQNAREWLVLVQRTLARNKQTEPLKHVDQALAEVNAALKAP